MMGKAGDYDVMNKAASSSSVIIDGQKGNTHSDS